MTTYYPSQKPALLTTVAVTTLVSGIVNLFWGFVASITVLSTIIGVVCLPLTILPTILGIFEIIYAAKLLSNPPQGVQPSTSIAILEILCFLVGNVYSMVVGILALVFYNDVTVRDYFARINGIQVPNPVPASTPVSLPEAKPAPVLPEPVIDPEAESPAPESEEKKPRGRKIAGQK